MERENNPPYFEDFDLNTINEVVVGEESSVELPETVDPDDDEVTITVELDQYGQFISFEEDEKTIYVRPESD